MVPVFKLLKYKSAVMGISEARSKSCDSQICDLVDTKILSEGGTGIYINNAAAKFNNE